MNDIATYFIRRLSDLNASAALAQAPRVLVVDDDNDFLSLAKDLLPDAIVDTANSPAQALEIIRRATPFSRLVVDLNFKDRLNGVDIIEALRAISPTVPITIVTAYADEDGRLKREAEERGMRLVGKQESIEALKEAIHP